MASGNKNFVLNRPGNPASSGFSGIFCVATKQYPGIDLRIVEAQSGKFKEKLMNCEIDFCLKWDATGSMPVLLKRSMDCDKEERLLDGTTRKSFQYKVILYKQAVWENL